MRIDQIERRHIKQFIQDPEMNKDAVSCHDPKPESYISAILSDAVEDELIKANPAVYTGKLIKKTDPPRRSIRLPGRKRTTRGDPQDSLPIHYPFFLTMLRTGLRLGEIIALKPGDLDLTAAS